MTATTTARAGGADAPVPPLCVDVQTWVEHIYLTTFMRRITQIQRWCPSWWAHPEAIVRLTALWQTWEAARASTDSSAMADWLRQYLDPMNPVLLAADGPFVSCTPDRHTEQGPLPATAPPSGYWDTLTARRQKEQHRGNFG